VAGTLNNLGILYRELNRMDDAGKAFEEGLAIYRELSKQAPERFAADVERIQAFVASLSSENP
jgi:hypothetical protein